MLLIFPFIAAAFVATIWVLIRVITHGREETIVTTICFISHIVWFEMFKNKNPTILTNGGETINFSINLSGRYRISNVICMKFTNMSIFAISFRKGGAAKCNDKTATSVERHLYNLAGC